MGYGGSTRKTTLVDVAFAAGVSVTTVDRVLNNRGGVQPAKEQRVLEQARKLRLDRALDLRPTRLLRFAVVMQAPSNPFYENLQAAFLRANQVFSASSIQCGIHHADVLKPARTVKLVRKVAAANDAIVIVYPENKEVSSALLEISRTIPVVTLVSDLPRSGRLAYVGLDNRSAGRVAGELMARFIGPSGGDIIVVSGLHSYIGHEEREMGFRSVLRERHPKCRVVAVLESREQTETAGELVAEVLRTRPGIAGIYNVSAGNRAIAATLLKAGSVGRTVFITHELTADRRALLKEGVLDAIIDQNPEIEVMTAVETLAHHFGRRDTPPPTKITPFDILIRESV